MIACIFVNGLSEHNCLECLILEYSPTGRRNKVDFLSIAARGPRCSRITTSQTELPGPDSNKQSEGCSGVML